MKKILLVILAVTLLTSCIGQFRLTRKVYDFNVNVGEKWVNELVFLGLIILPVYSLASLGDAIIFNSIEFWSGENPLAKSGEKLHKVVDSGNNRVVMTYNQKNEKIRIDSFRSFSPESTIIIEKHNDGVIARDASGKAIYTSSMDKEGGITVYGANEEVIKYFTPEEVRASQK